MPLLPFIQTNLSELIKLLCFTMKGEIVIGLL